MTPAEADPFDTPVAEKTDDTSMVEHKDQILYGSDTLPATFQIDGETVALGTIVAAAFEKSGLSEDAWNALPADERDAKLHAELDARGANGPDGQLNTSGAPLENGADPVGDRKILAGDQASAASHDTKHETGLSDQDARVAGDAAPLAGGTVIVEDKKEPLGSLPDTARTTEDVSRPLTLDTDVSDRPNAGLTDAVMPTKPGGADMQDVLDDHAKDVVSKAPKRSSEGLVADLDLHWSEFKHKVSMVTGDLDGELGAAIDLARSQF